MTERVMDKTTSRDNRVDIQELAMRKNRSEAADGRGTDTCRLGSCRSGIGTPSPAAAFGGLGFGHMVRLRRRRQCRRGAQHGAEHAVRPCDGAAAAAAATRRPSARRNEGGTGKATAVAAAASSGHRPPEHCSLPGGNRRNLADTAAERHRRPRWRRRRRWRSGGGMPPRGERRFVPDEVITAFSAEHDTASDRAARAPAQSDAARNANLAAARHHALPLADQRPPSGRRSRRRDRGRAHRRERAAQLSFHAAGGRSRR